MPLSKTFRSLILGFITALSLPLFAVSIEHELGITDVPDHPKRIVVLEFSFVDALASINVAPVGIADDNKPERIISAYTDAIGHDWISVGSRKTPSLELIASLKPDLIIADKKRSSAAYGALSEIAPTIVLDSLVVDHPTMLKQISVIGKALGKEAEMEKRIADHKAKMAAYAKEFNVAGKDVYLQFGYARAKGLTLHSPYSFTGSLIGELGFTSNLTSEEKDLTLAKAYIPTTLEQLSELNPDILVLGIYADKTLMDDWKEEPLYQNITAVKSDNIYHVNAHNWSRLRGMISSEMTAHDLSDIVEKVSQKNK